MQTYGVRLRVSVVTMRAPARTMPSSSCGLPTEKPGSSAKYTSGRWNVSQSSIRRMVFSPAAMSMEPPLNFGWLAITPTGWPLIRASPVTRARP